MKQLPPERKKPRCKMPPNRLTILIVMAKNKAEAIEVACPDCGAMLKIDATTGVLVSHTSAPRKRMFEDLETAAKAMREHGERTESIFRQSVDAEKNKADLLEKRLPRQCARRKTPRTKSRCAKSTWISHACGTRFPRTIQVP